VQERRGARFGLTLVEHDALQPPVAAVQPGDGDRKPCMAWTVALRGWPLSASSTLRRARPSMSAAFSPAGPPPAMTTSNMRWLLTVDG